MGRPSWASAKQEKWLKNNIPFYCEAQRRRNVGNFNEDTVAAYFQKFPFVPAGTENERVRDDNVDYTVAPSLKIARAVRLPSIHN